MTTRPHPPRTMQLVALFEAIKGLAVLAGGFGLLSLLHRDVRHLAEALIAGLHLDPDRHFPHIFLEASSQLTDARLWLLAGLAALYASVRLAEAYGLWRGYRWGAWLGAAGGAIYVPVELYELLQRVSPLRVATLLLNVAIVVYLLWMLERQRRAAPVIEVG
ncbi:DUF2127 domain-containing protein [Rhizobacter sp. P5_C2]